MSHTTTPDTTGIVLAALNDYQGDNIWEDVIYSLDYDDTATSWVGSDQDEAVVIGGAVYTCRGGGNWTLDTTTDLSAAAREAADEVAHMVYQAVPGAEMVSPVIAGDQEYRWTSADGQSRIVWGADGSVEGDPAAYINAERYELQDNDPDCWVPTGHVGCDADARAVDYFLALCQ